MPPLYRQLSTRLNGRIVRLLLLAAVLASPVTAAGEQVDPFLGNSYFQSVKKPTASAVLADESAATDDGIERLAFASDLASASEVSPAIALEPSTSNFADVNFADVYVEGDAPTQLIGYERPAGGDHWQLLPDGLIFRSFLAGPREPRISTHIHDNYLAGVQNSETLWSGTVGGRRGLIRFGNNNPLRPTGVQLDIEGAAIVRLNLDEERDVDGSDFRFGVPLTWGDECIQYEFGYYHLSSHIGDEFLVRNPGFTRVNYVRDVIKFGVSYYPVPNWRVYGQVGYAVFIAGGAEPWECQFGAEYSKPGVTTIWGTPFFAVNAHLREELDFGGDFTTQAGWLWRGKSGSTFRAALHYQNGDSTSYQFFDTYEEQIGLGLFYDF